MLTIYRKGGLSHQDRQNRTLGDIGGLLLLMPGNNRATTTFKTARIHEGRKRVLTCIEVSNELGKDVSWGSVLWRWVGRM